MTLLGNPAALFKTALAGQLRLCDEAVRIFTPDVVTGPRQQGLTFLLGTDNPHAHDAHAERLLRSGLDRHGICYQVLYGTTDECLAQALQVIRSRLSHQTDESDSRPKVPLDQPGPGNSRWVWSCEKCSDPACEHQLLTGLLANRKTRTTELLP